MDFTNADFIRKSLWLWVKMQNAITEKSLRKLHWNSPELDRCAWYFQWCWGAKEDLPGKYSLWLELVRLNPVLRGFLQEQIAAQPSPQNLAYVPAHHQLSLRHPGERGTSPNGGRETGKGCCNGHTNFPADFSSQHPRMHFMFLLESQPPSRYALKTEVM